MSGNIPSASVLLLALLALPRIALSMAWAGPEPTPAHDLRQRALLHGRTPLPTSAPRLTRALLKRQQEPNICGYESGRSLHLARRAAHGSELDVGWLPGGALERDRVEEELARVILDYVLGGPNVLFLDHLGGMGSAWLLPRFRPRGLRLGDVDDRVIKCTGMASYCQTFRYLGVSVLDYGCDRSSSSSRTRLVDITYSGQTLASTNFRMATPTASSTRSTRITTTRRSNVGAIVGGVVGGLFALAIIVTAVLLFLFCSRRHRRRNQAAAAAAAVAAPAAGTQYPPGPGPAGYGPVSQDVQPPMQQQAPPQTYYAPVPGKDDPPYGGVQPSTTPLPPYHRDSYMSAPGTSNGTSPPPPPPPDVHQLHGQSVSPPPPPPPQVPGLPPMAAPQPTAYNPMPAPNPGPVYEAPGENYHR
ncbi:MAG: hypothetical protein M1823_004359 [Watsoniomyces obsoletus]|nr:MAG: hypothetical protein M1823_004359 [Watsoniomyces obsoletus]